MKKFVSGCLMTLFALPAFAADNVVFTRLEPLGSWDPNNLTPGQTVNVLYGVSRTGDGQGATLTMSVALDGDDIVNVPQSVGSNWSLDGVATGDFQVPTVDGIYDLEGCLVHQDAHLASQESDSNDNCLTLTLYVGNYQSASLPTNQPATTVGGRVEDNSVHVNVNGVDFSLVGITNTCGSGDFILPYSMTTFPENYVALLDAKRSNDDVIPLESRCDGTVAVVDSLQL